VVVFDGSSADNKAVTPKQPESLTGKHLCVTLGHMRRKTIRELHLRTGAIVGEAVKLGRIVITRRGVPIAEILPFRRGPDSQGLPDRESWLAKFPQVRGDSGRFLEEDRS